MSQQQQPPTATATPDSASTSASTTSYLDLAITLLINAWPALTLAVQSNWGGPTSADKRDWLCGAISDMLAERPETDAEDLEDVLIQVMNDEFDVVVDDESAAEVAGKIIEMRTLTERGEVGVIREMWEEWERKRAVKGGGDVVAGFRRVDGEEDEDDEDDDEEDSDEDEDVDMGEAPALVRAPRERVEPEVDEDGFTKVVGKKRR